jgi:hypothetical protein
MVWLKRFFLLLPFVIAALLTALIIRAEYLHHNTQHLVVLWFSLRNALDVANRSNRVQSPNLTAIGFGQPQPTCSYFGFLRRFIPRRYGCCFF